MVPSGYKEDTVYSVVPSDGSGDLSFTRASNGTRINSAGLVEVVAWNLLEQSETFDNAAWGKEFTTITANNITAPNGTLTADRFTLGIGTEQKFIYQLASQNGTYTQSVYLKKGTHTFVQLAVGGDVNPYCNFDLTNGTFSAFGSTATMTNVGDEWYRCTMTYSTSIGTYVFIFATNSLSSARTALTSSTGNYYAWGAQLNIGSTAKPYFPTTDRLNVPRLTYQNGGGGCPSLLLEKQSTNLLTWSEDFSNGSYGKGDGIVIATNTTTSPDGTQNADKVYTNTTVNGDHYLNKSPFASVSSSTAYTYSIFAKKGEFNYISIESTIQNDLYKAATINLNDGSVSNNTYSITPKVENYGNGWYRISVFGTTSSSQTSADTYIILLNNSQQRFYTGDGVSGIYTYGWQLEASSYPTSYIPTTSSSATRVADVAQKTGISSLIGQTSGTVFADFYLTNGYDNNQMVLTLSDNTSSNFIIIQRYLGSMGCRIDASGALQLDSYPTFTNSGRHKIALAYASNDVKVYLDGSAIITDTSVTVPAMSKINIGSFYDETLQLGSSINEVVLFKTRLTNAELASLTTI